MGNLHSVDFLNNRGFLIPCVRPGFVYTTILRWLSVFLTVSISSNDSVNCLATPEVIYKYNGH